MSKEYIFKNPAQWCWTLVATVICGLHGALTFSLLADILPAIKSQSILGVGCIVVVASIEIAAVSTTLPAAVYKLTREGLEVYRKPISMGTGGCGYFGMNAMTRISVALMFLLFFLIWPSWKGSDAWARISSALPFLPLFLILTGQKSTIFIPWGAIATVSQENGLLGEVIRIEFSEKMGQDKVSQEVIKLPFKSINELREAVLRLAPVMHPFRNFCEKDLTN